MKSVRFEITNRQVWFAGVVMIAVAALGCGTQKKPSYEYVPNMMDSPAVKAQHLGPWGEGMRTPPAGTMAQDGVAAYPYPKDPELAGKMLKNPLPRTIEVMKRGEKIFNTYCIVCHGPRGEGDGTIIPKFPRPPSLQSERARNYPDGRIFHIVTMGQNLMPSYASQISREDRWAAIHYVRVIQRAMNPTKQDLEKLEKGL